MITTMIRKEYTVPAVEIFDVEVESMLAASPPIGFNPGEDNDTEWTNKRKPVNNSPWDSSNWSTNE